VRAIQQQSNRPIVLSKTIKNQRRDKSCLVWVSERFCGGRWKPVAHRERWGHLGFDPQPCRWEWL